MKIISIIFMTLLFFAQSFAQQPGTVQPERGLKIGKILFYPAVLFGLEYDDNLFLRSEDYEELYGIEVLSDNVYTVKPSFRFELPFSHSFAKLAYIPQYKKYSDLQIDDKISHSLNLDTLLNFSNGMRISLKEDYSKGILETELFDPGGETEFRADKFTYSAGTLGLSYDFAGVRGLEAKLSYDNLEFDRKIRSSFFDYNAEGLKASYYQNLSTRLTIVTDYSYRNFVQEIPIYDLSDVLVDFREDEFNEYIVAVGFRGNVLKRTTGYAALSYTKLDFLGDITGSDFSGLTGEANLRTRFSNKLALDFGLRRYAYQSNFFDNKYYLSNRFSAGGNYYFGRFTYLTARGSYSLNNYSKAVFFDPDSLLSDFSGIKREDNLARLDLGFNHLFTPIMGFRVGYTYSKRDSNIDIYGYDDNRYFVQVGFGWF